MASPKADSQRQRIIAKYATVKEKQEIADLDQTIEVTKRFLNKLIKERYNIQNRAYMRGYTKEYPIETNAID